MLGRVKARSQIDKEILIKVQRRPNATLRGGKNLESKQREREREAKNPNLELERL